MTESVCLTVSEVLELVTLAERRGNWESNGWSLHCPEDAARYTELLRKLLEGE